MTWIVLSHVYGISPQISQMSMVSVFTSKLVNLIRQMPYRIDFKANVIQIIGGHFYTAIDTLCDTDYKWVPLVPKANGYFNHIYLFF